MYFQPRLGAFRSFLVLGGGLFANFGFRSFGVPGSGALGCLVLAFIAAHHWRKQGWPGGKVKNFDCFVAVATNRLLIK